LQRCVCTVVRILCVTVSVILVDLFLFCLCSNWEEVEGSH